MLKQRNAALFSIYLILHTVFGLNDEEPSCMPSCNYDMLNRLIMLEQEVKYLRQTVESQKGVIGNLEGQVKDLEPDPVIAFMADLTSSLTGSNYRIYFNDVKLNIGSAYRSKHGLFIAPVSGMYQFSVSACSSSGQYIVLDLMQSDTLLGRMLAGGTTYDSCNSKVFLASLLAGDDVYVQHVETGDYLLASNGYGYPSFTGVLLHTT
ncbi:complement C1q tumor necrosis factor-related protein 3-like [Ruditapes philippinarum]|uniref:complement C1q tumor necrosis factor-related protein 3-like n=1 Tax=Ruditapes philippinarum TaxID=129788 RepID=UPI00295B0DF1|nr:complement C1q tumor necrosis factor-related protein 3-like [Ruditapes philippinarum]